MLTPTQMTHAASQQSEALGDFITAMHAHQIDLRLDINRVEYIVGCIAKSNAKEVVNHLPEVNLAISHLRECLSTFEAHRRMFEDRQRNFDA